jgi:hypothetical protein
MYQESKTLHAPDKKGVYFFYEVAGKTPLAPPKHYPNIQHAG